MRKGQKHKMRTSSIVCISQAHQKPPVLRRNVLWENLIKAGVVFDPKLLMPGLCLLEKIPPVLLFFGFIVRYGEPQASEIGDGMWFGNTSVLCEGDKEDEIR